MKLYLIRHGQAAAIPPDPEQYLTSAGRAGIEKLSCRLGKKGLKVSQIFHSEKARARETAEIMAAQIGPDIRLNIHKHIKPNDDPQWLANDIANWDADTLIVSHLPFIPALLNLLVVDASTSYGISFEPGTVICLTPNAGHWKIEWVEEP